MRKFHIAACMAIVVLTASCFKDKSVIGTTPEQITVTGINASYDRVSMVDSINISPVVKSTDPAAKFQYYWGIYETNVLASVPKVDTISKSLNLKYFVKQPAKGWVLVFMAKNTNTGYTQYATSSLNVITQFTRGWYVLKDDGSKTDMDLFLTPTTIVPSSKMENLFSLVNGKKLDGKAKSLNFESTYKSMVTGTLGNTRAMFIATTKDASIINVNTLLEIHDFNGLFYTSPAVKAPNAMMVGMSADYFVNNGLIHSIYAMGINSGIFGNYQMRDAVNSPYRMSDFYYSYYLGDPIFFDETSSSFLSAGGGGSILNTVTDAVGTNMQANKNNKTLLYMGAKSTSSAVALFADKNNENLKILSAITPTVNAFKMTNDTLLATNKLYNSKIVTCNYTDENMIYFVVGSNQVWSRNLTNKVEQLQYTAPAGETIVYIRHKKYTESANTAYSYNYVMVGTTDGTNYNVRMFTKTAGNLAAAPALTLTGKGANVGDVFYLSPTVNYQTYQNSY